MRAIAFLVSLILLLHTGNIKAFGRTGVTGKHFITALKISKNNNHHSSYSRSPKNNGSSSVAAVDRRRYILPSPLQLTNSKLLSVVNFAVKRISVRNTPVWAENSAFSSEDAEDDNRNGFAGKKQHNPAIYNLNPTYHFVVNFFHKKSYHSSSLSTYHLSDIYIFQRNLRI
jgi:hypothetical protein